MSGTRHTSSGSPRPATPLSSNVSQCEYVYCLGSYSKPPEQCEEDALEGKEFCSRHLHGYDEDWDGFDWP